MKKILYLILFILIVSVVVYIGFFNAQIVPLSLGSYTIEAPLVVALLLFFAFGLLVGYLISLPRRMQLSRQLKKAQRNQL